MYPTDSKHNHTLSLLAVPVQFITRPFVVGDRITLKTTDGQVVISGIVETIRPMRTVIRSDDNLPEVCDHHANGALCTGVRVRIQGLGLRVCDCGSCG